MTRDRRDEERLQRLIADGRLSDPGTLRLRTRVRDAILDDCTSDAVDETERASLLWPLCYYPFIKASSISKELIEEGLGLYVQLALFSQASLRDRSETKKASDSLMASLTLQQEALLRQGDLERYRNRPDPSDELYFQALLLHDASGARPLSHLAIAAAQRGQPGRVAMYCAIARLIERMWAPPPAVIGTSSDSALIALVLGDRTNVDVSQFAPLDELSALSIAAVGLAVAADLPLNSPSSLDACMRMFCSIWEACGRDDMPLAGLVLLAGAVAAGVENGIDAVACASGPKFWSAFCEVLTEAGCGEPSGAIGIEATVADEDVLLGAAAFLKQWHRRVFDGTGVPGNIDVYPCAASPFGLRVRGVTEASLSVERRRRLLLCAGIFSSEEAGLIMYQDGWHAIDAVARRQQRATQFMTNLAAERLKDKVKTLEGTANERRSVPHIFPDSLALSSQLSLCRRLTTSKARLQLVITTAALRGLDRLKVTDSEARAASHWIAKSLRGHGDSERIRLEGDGSTPRIHILAPDTLISSELVEIIASAAKASHAGSNVSIWSDALAEAVAPTGAVSLRLADGQDTMQIPVRASSSFLPKSSVPSMQPPVAFSSRAFAREAYQHFQNSTPLVVDPEAARSKK